MSEKAGRKDGGGGSRFDNPGGKPHRSKECQAVFMAAEATVVVKQKVLNKRLLIVAEPDGTLAKMRVRDSGHYRMGEKVVARVQHDLLYEPVMHRNRPFIGGLVG